MIVKITVRMNVTTYPFTKRHKLVHNGGFPKLKVLYCNQNAVKSVKIH